MVLVCSVLFWSCQIEKRVYRKGFHIQSNFSLKGMRKNKPKKTFEKSIAQSRNQRLEESQDSNRVIIDSKQPSKSIGKEELINIQKSAKSVTQFNEPTRLNSKRKQNKKQNMTNSVEKEAIKSKLVSEQKLGVNNKTWEGVESPKEPKSSKRKTAILLGASLLLMFVLSLVAFPLLGSVAASIALISIFLLDAVVAWAVFKYHKPENPKLAKTSGILRGMYTAVLGIAIGYHLAGNVAMFNHIWGLGLIVFGLHLITLGIMYNNEGGKKWVNILIKSLLIAAGIGYVIQYVGMLIIPNPAGFVLVMESIFMLPMVLGELFYAIWMLSKGGKQA